MSEVVKRSITIRGHRTSFSLEDAFFEALQTLAIRNGTAVAALVAAIDTARPRQSSLSSALRLHVLHAAKRGELSEPAQGVPSAVQG